MRRMCLWLALLLVCLGTVVAQKRTGGGGKAAPPNLGSKSGRVIGQDPRTMSSMSSGVPANNPTIHHAYDEHRVEFTSETVLIQVPVVVTEQAGAHVRGLARDDFQLFEDGKLQKIAGFEEIEASRSPLPTSAPVKGEYSNLATTGEAPRTITVIALDTVNTPFLDQAYARKQLVKYLAENVQSDQVLGLVSITSKGLKILHGLTSDPSALVQALKKVNGEIPAMQGTDIDVQAAAASTDVTAPGPIITMGVNSDPEQMLQDFILHGDATIARLQQDRAVEVTMRSFLNIAWSLSGVSGRKSVLWATGGFPFYLDQPSAVPAGYLGPLYEEMMQALNNAEISIYPVDVRGLVNYSSASDVNYAPRGAALQGSAFATSLAARSWLHNSTLDTLRDFADMTGGRAFYNSNDLAGGFHRAAEDSSCYYLLTYYLDTSNTKPGWRQLKVKVNRKGAEVRSRNGFFVTNATLNYAANRKTDIAFAVSSPFESTGVPIQVRWQKTTTSTDKSTVGFLLHVPPNGFTIDQGDKNKFDVDLLAVAIKENTEADNVAQSLRGAMSSEMLAQVQTDGLTYSNSLLLAPGQYTVRFVVRDNLSGKVGSVTAPLTVN